MQRWQQLRQCTHRPRGFPLRALRWVVWLALRGLERLPWAATYRLADWLGEFFFWAYPRYRRIALENLEQALGDVCPEAERWRLARRTFRNLMRALLEFLKTPQLGPEGLREKVALEGEEHIRRAHQEGKGIIFVTGHLGNWEWLGSRVAQEYPLSVVAREQDDPKLEEWVRQLRERNGLRVLSRSEVGRMLRTLRRGEALGMLVDQNTVVGSVFVPFFGRLAATVAGPVVLAKRSGAPILPIFIHRCSQGHRAVCYPPLRLDCTDDPQEDMRRNVARMTRAIQWAIEEHPDEWLWFHRRWRTRPSESEG